MNIRLVSGRLFEKDKPNDKSNTIISKKFAAKMGWSHPLEESFSYDSVKYKVIGIIEDFHHTGFYAEVLPIFFVLDNESDFKYFTVQVEQGNKLSVSEDLGLTWQHIAPNDPYDVFYQEDALRGFYQENKAHIVIISFISGFADRSPGQITGVLYDVPLIRQALTGKAILPQATKIALLATADSVELYEPLIDELPAYGMSARIFLVESNDNLISTLVRALGYGDFLLAAPDSAIYNPRTIKHILLTAYRRNQIVIGPTQAYVKAGSLASSYAPFPEMIEMAGEFLTTYFETGEFPSPSYPENFRVEVNAQVARSLNIPLPSREDIAARVDRQLTVNGEASDE